MSQRHGREGEIGWERIVECQGLVGFVELHVGEERGDFGWGLVREGAFSVGRRVEGEGAVVQHLLGVVVGVGGRLDAEVPEHSIRFPAAEEHDGVFVDPGAKKGRGPARAEGLGGEELVVDAGGRSEQSSSMAEAVGNMCRGDVVPAVVVRVRIEVSVERAVRSSFHSAQAEGDAAEGFART